MTRDEYLQLFQKFLAGNATPDEVEKIMSYQDDFDLADSAVSTDDTEQQLRGQRILHQISDTIAKQNSASKYNHLWLAAAVILTITSIGLLFLKDYQPATPQKVAAKTSILHDVKPGTNKALLTLENGKQIALNDMSTGTVLKQGHIAVVKQKNGLLQYQVTSNTRSAQNLPVEYNTISTPVGGEYSVVLPDGSKLSLIHI